ncbi:nuclear transport factor 2 family protein [Azohydromonas caseinilytica]|uniref:DUF4440 domain-containing protein n=1 Tax=Azohydromonas caseinilytica TaxID=2728836 RepID=A0A848FKL3_9BURK|nr:DUF4440 domain-containing protein [Azohydromonas caseinilytica]NML18783.1 DUF4440 domain-containing protein [Azohydromonas caseinilytica]
MTPSLLDQLQSLESELHHPGRPCSRARLEQLLHPGFHEVGRSGNPYGRDTVLDYLAAQTAAPPVENWGHTVHLLAPDCALLTYRSARRGADGSLSEEALRSSIWLRTAAGWQLFHHQGTPAPGSA